MQKSQCEYRRASVSLALIVRHSCVRPRRLVVVLRECGHACRDMCLSRNRGGGTGGALGHARMRRARTRTLGDGARGLVYAADEHRDYTKSKC